MRTFPTQNCCWRCCAPVPCLRRWRQARQRFLNCWSRTRRLPIRRNANFHLRILPAQRGWRCVAAQRHRCLGRAHGRSRYRSGDPRSGADAHQHPARRRLCARRLSQSHGPATAIPRSRQLRCGYGVEGRTDSAVRRGPAAPAQCWFTRETPRFLADESLRGKAGLAIPKQSDTRGGFADLAAGTSQGYARMIASGKEAMITATVTASKCAPASAARMPIFCSASRPMRTRAWNSLGGESHR